MPRYHGYRRPEASQAHGGSPCAQEHSGGSAVCSWGARTGAQCGRGDMADGPVLRRPHTSPRRAGRSSPQAPLAAMRLRWEEGVRTSVDIQTRHGQWSKATAVPAGHPAEPTARRVAPGGLRRAPVPASAGARPAPALTP